MELKVPREIASACVFQKVRNAAPKEMPLKRVEYTAHHSKCCLNLSRLDGLLLSNQSKGCWG